MQLLSTLGRSFKIRSHIVFALQSVVLSTSLLPTIQSNVSSDNKCCDVRGHRVKGGLCLWWNAPAKCIEEICGEILSTIIIGQWSKLCYLVVLEKKIEAKGELTESSWWHHDATWLQLVSMERFSFLTHCFVQRSYTEGRPVYLE